MKAPKSFYQVSRFKYLDLKQNRSLFIEFSTLCSLNGFRNVSEIKVIEFVKSEDQKSNPKVVFEKYSQQMRSLPVMSFFDPNSKEISFLETRLSEQQIAGSIPSTQGKIQWSIENGSLAESPGTTGIQRKSFSLIQRLLPYFPKKLFFKTYEKPVRGWLQKNNNKESWDNSQAKLSFFSGSKFNTHWSYLSCENFTDPQGKSVELKVEGIEIHNKVLGLFSLPRSVFYSITLNGEETHFRSARHLPPGSSDAPSILELESKSKVYKIQRSIRPTDFFCISREDTEGRLHYHSIAPMIDLSVLVYDGGKLVSHFAAKSAAHYEQVSRNKPQAIGVVN
jgi:hypothetical protein